MSDWTETHRVTLERWVASFGGENWADTAAAINATRAALAEIARLTTARDLMDVRARAAEARVEVMLAERSGIPPDKAEAR